MRKTRAIFYSCLMTAAIGACLAGDLYGKENPNLATPEARPPDARPAAYECPRTNYINCMPPIQGEAKILCSREYLDWARTHCPGVEVVY